MTKRTWGWLGGLLLITTAALANQKTVNSILQTCQIIASTMTTSTITQSSFNGGTIDNSPIGQTSPAAVTGTTVTATVSVRAPVVNAANGYQVNGAAPAGHTLCGNGSAYVDSASSCQPTIPQGQLTHPSRAMNVTYTNTAGAVLLISGAASTSSGSVGSVVCRVNGTQVFQTEATATTDQGVGIGFNFAVPAGSTYVCQNGGAVGAVTVWTEVALK